VLTMILALPVLILVIALVVFVVQAVINKND
jgi:hypothetical protein